MDCPDDNILAAFAGRGLDSDERASIELHLDACAGCCAVVSQLAAVFDSRESVSQPEPSERSLDGQTVAGDLSDSSPDPAEAHRLRKGEAVGRYVILFRVGSGGMGVVYAAYDPELDRKLALKVLRRPAGSADQPLLSSARRPDKRMMREAQALARLSHPNVIAIHDVGTHDGMPFIAMEFIEGGTLKQWLAGKHRSVGEIVLMFTAAGRGLAAAHAKGMIHRDFKPDNVLIGGPDHAIVTDFGLARPAEASSDGHMQTLEGQRGAAALEESITQTGALVGTPAYMPPEQFRGQRSDARGDQFSFCVALYEALFGERPFAGKTFAELMTNVTTGRLRVDSGAASVPTWAKRVVLRGLSVDPAARFASMDDLLAALRPARTRWMWLAAAAAGGAAIASVGLVASGVGSPAYCEQVETQLDGVWDAGVRTAVDAAIAGTQLGFAGQTAELTVGRLDDYATSWTAAQNDVCENERTTRQPSSVIAQRMMCLARARDALGTATAILAAATSEDAMHASDIVVSLPPIETCDDVAELFGEVAPPSEDDAEAVSAIRSAIARTDVLLSAARSSEAAKLLDEIAGSVDKVGYRPVRAEYLQAAAAVDDAAGDATAAYDKLHLALGEAIRSHHTFAVAKIASDIGRISDERRGAGLETLRWVAVGEAALDAVAGDHLEIRAQLAAARAMGLVAQGDLEGSLSASHQALALRERAHGPGHWSLSEPLSKMGLVEARLGRYADSAAHIERAGDLLASRYGDAHPLYAFTLQNLAISFFRQGNFAEAARLSLSAADVLKKALGPTHPSVAVAVYTAGLAQLGAGELAAAQASAEAALAIEADRHGALAPETSASRGLLGHVFQLAGRYDESERALEMAISSIANTDDAARVRIANLRSLIGNTARLRGDPDAATVHLRAAEDVLRELAPNSGELAETLSRQAVVAFDTEGDKVKARALVGDAIAIFEGKDDVSFERAEAQILLLRLLDADPETTPEQRATARELAEDHVEKFGTAAQRRQLATLGKNGDDSAAEPSP